MVRRGRKGHQALCARPPFSRLGGDPRRQYRYHSPVRVIVRPPSHAFRRALSGHPERDRIDPGRALQQHERFVSALLDAGATVVPLPADPELPDAPFVSDAILALPVASDAAGPAALLVETRPAEPSRRPEVESVIALARSLVGAAVPSICLPTGETLEGGDVVVLGDRILIGASARTSRKGAEWLASAVRDLGYAAFVCPVSDRLHLATAVTAVTGRLLVGTAAGFTSIDAGGPDAAPVDLIGRLVIPDSELPAANVLPVEGRCIVAAGNPTAIRLLRAATIDPVEVELDEFTRADGGPTCLVAIVP
jgi:dimethylargininase